MGVSADLSNYLTLFGAKELVKGSPVTPVTFNAYPFQAFIVNDNATITNLQYSINSNDIKSNFGIGAAPNNIVYRPAYIAADQNNEFGSITIAGGSVLIIALTGSYSTPVI